MTSNHTGKRGKWIVAGILMTACAALYIAIMYKIVHYGP